MAVCIWDEAKRESNLEKHGIDFVDAATIFEDRFRLERTDGRRDYGEARIQATGFGQGKLMFVVYTRRGDLRRLISARLANRNERQRYEEEKKTAPRKPY